MNSFKNIILFLVFLPKVVLSQSCNYQTNLPICNINKHADEYCRCKPCVGLKTEIASKNQFCHDDGSVSNSCDNNLCLNGGACISIDSTIGGTCLDPMHKFTCDCLANTHGFFCQDCTNNYTGNDCQTCKENYYIENNQIPIGLQSNGFFNRCLLKQTCQAGENFTNYEGNLTDRKCNQHVCTCENGNGHGHARHARRGVRSAATSSPRHQPRASA